MTDKKSQMKDWGWVLVAFTVGTLFGGIMGMARGYDQGWRAGADAARCNILATYADSWGFKPEQYLPDYCPQRKDVT